MVRADHIKTKNRSKKLNHKLRGKFKIKWCIGTCAYELELPLDSGKIHPVFHIGLFKLYHENTIPNRREVTLLPVDIEENQYEVEAIRDLKGVNRTVKYLVAWKGFGPDEILRKYMSILWMEVLTCLRNSTSYIHGSLRTQGLSSKILFYDSRNRFW